MAERGILDAIGDLLGPAQAEAAPFPQVMKALLSLGSKGFNKKTAQAMELLTEGYPSVQRAPLVVQPLVKGKSHYFPQSLPGLENKVSNLPSKEEFIQGVAPGIITLTGPSAKYKFPPEYTYSHEGGHAVSGGFSNLMRWLKNEGLQLSDLDTHSAMRAAPEGFAEAIGNMLLGRYGNEAFTSYWPAMYKATKNPAYLQAGTLGREVGETLREGKLFPQDQLLDAMIEIVKRNR